MNLQRPPADDLGASDLLKPKTWRGGRRPAQLALRASNINNIEFFLGGPAAAPPSRTIDLILKDRLLRGWRSVCASTR